MLDFGLKKFAKCWTLYSKRPLGMSINKIHNISFLNIMILQSVLSLIQVNFNNIFKNPVKQIFYCMLFYIA